MSDTPKCDHTWEETTVAFCVSGRKWKQAGMAHYCPKCRKFGTRTTMFMDGHFYKTQREADLANAEANELYRTETLAWQHEHYPEHAA